MSTVIHAGQHAGVALVHTAQHESDNAFDHFLGSCFGLLTMFGGSAAATPIVGAFPASAHFVAAGVMSAAGGGYLMGVRLGKALRGE